MISDQGFSPDMRFTATCVQSPPGIEAPFVSSVFVTVEDESFLNTEMVVLPWPTATMVQRCGPNFRVPNQMQLLAYEFLVPCVEECSTPIPSDQPTPYICDEPKLSSSAGDAVDY